MKQMPCQLPVCCMRLVQNYKNNYLGKYVSVKIFKSRACFQSLLSQYRILWKKEYMQAGETLIL